MENLLFVPWCEDKGKVFASMGWKNEDQVFSFVSVVWKSDEEMFASVVWKAQRILGGYLLFTLLVFLGATIEHRKSLFFLNYDMQ